MNSYRNIIIRPTKLTPEPDVKSIKILLTRLFKIVSKEESVQ